MHVYFHFRLGGVFGAYPRAVVHIKFLPALSPGGPQTKKLGLPVGNATSDIQQYVVGSEGFGIEIDSEYVI